NIQSYQINIMSITSDEVNLLVYKYLQESGYNHAAFAFFNESNVARSSIAQLAEELPHGKLVTYLQKGLQYTQVETHLMDDGSESQCTESFSLVLQHVCSKVLVVPASKKERERENDKHKEREKDRDKDRDRDRHKNKDKVQEKNKSKDNDVKMRDSSDKDKDKDKEKEKEKENDKKEISNDQVIILEGHKNEVFICEWNPKMLLLASGSGDSTARIWDLSNVTRSSGALVPSIVLDHQCMTDSEKAIDVTTLDWNVNGAMLATGSYDGIARVWSNKGELLHRLTQHRAPIFTLRWNQRGDYLLSGSVDKTSIVWDMTTGEMLQQFEFHQAPTLDIDWRNNHQFASCSTDQTIHVCELGKTTPIKTFLGHQDEINAIKWDPSGRLLASCSDDYTAKIWNMNSDTFVQDLKKHTQGIYTIKWSPTGPGSANPNKSLLLASASFDNTVKLWDVETSTCVLDLDKHSDPVYSVAFSPNGEYLASGSFDKCLYIWSIKDGSVVKTYKGNGGIFDISWNPSGDRLSACFSDSTVCVIDVK
ncbi:hypothetical protein SAMD00019534_061500, partial [Acytostelium subglobosum LB1]|uniref:hypothetical protein n=1 Tax=Acytostelium subglobosum LB1 TaxID=1410327 RepID=UPI0006449959